MVPINPTNVKEFYPFAVHIIYAVIITLSFQIAGEIFVPFDSIISSYDTEVRAFALLLNYVVVISGWIGYTKSIGKRQHSETWLGTARFIVDLVIMFLVFYLITLTDVGKIKEFVSIFNTYIWIFPTIFFAYIVWDIIKYFEYRNAQAEKRVGFNRTIKTAYFTIPLFIQAWLYSYIVPQYHDMLHWGQDSIWELLFIASTIIIILLYRKSKWLVAISPARKLKKPEE